MTDIEITKITVSYLFEELTSNNNTFIRLPITEQSYVSILILNIIDLIALCITKVCNTILKDIGTKHFHELLVACYARQPCFFHKILLIVEYICVDKSY